MNMTFEQAMEIVNEYRGYWKLPGLLETLQQMSDCEDDLSSSEFFAYRKCMREFGKLFATA